MPNRVMAMRRTRALGGLLAMALLLGASPLADAAPRGSKRLPLSTFGGLVHDRQHGRIFIVGYDDSKLVVVDHSGRIVETIEGLRGTTGLTLGGGLVYVSLRGGDEIAVIDPETLQVTERIPTDPHRNPGALARTGDYLWVSVNCFAEPLLIAIDVTSGEMHEYEAPFTECAHLTTSPTEGDVLFAWMLSAFDTPVRRYRVEPSLLPGQPPTLTVEAETQVPAAYDAEVSLNGERLYLGGDGIKVLRASDLEHVQAYTAGKRVAVTPEEDYVVGGSWGLDSIVSVFEVDRPRAAYRARVPDEMGDVATIDDAARIFVVTDPYDQNALFQTVAPWFALRASKRQEVGPAGHEGALAWSQTDAPGARHLNAFVERGGNAVRINRPGTEGVVGGFDDGLVSYTERKRGRMDVFLYDVESGDRRDPGRKVNTRAVEYLPGVSGPWLMFGRYTHGGRGRKLLLFNRDTRRIRTLDSTRGRSPILIPGQMNDPWAVWFECARQCTVYRHNVTTRKTVRVPRAKNTRDVSASVAPDGTVYFERVGPRCGQRASIMRYQPGRRPVVVKIVPGGVEVTATFFSETADRDELLVGTFDCREGQSDIVKSHEP
jgi:YVTN family beta-propeller protein